MNDKIACMAHIMALCQISSQLFIYIARATASILTTTITSIIISLYLLKMYFVELLNVNTYKILSQLLPSCEYDKGKLWLLQGNIDLKLVETRSVYIMRSKVNRLLFNYIDIVFIVEARFVHTYCTS